MNEAVVIALELLGLGWGGIFIVMFIIYLVSLALSKLFAPHETDEP